jgi:fucose permease
MDVTMNLVGAGVERASGKKIFATFHGAFSLGGMVGGIMGGLIGEAGVPLSVHIVAVAAAGLIAGLVALSLIGRGEGEAPHEAQEGDSDLPMASVIVLGAIAFAALVGEGVVADWSAILLVDYREAGAQEAGIAFAAFSAAMTVGRLTGDRVIHALGRRAVVGYGGVLAAVGLAVALAVDGTVAAATGFAIAGLGLSCMFPALLAAAVAASPHRPGAAMAAVATLGYFGFLVGPPAIGFGAEAATLPVALSGVVVLLAAAAAASLLMPGPARR